MRPIRIFLRMIGGLTVAVVFTAMMIAPWLAQPQDIDRFIAIFTN